MKKSITYREISVAIGILVAMVIALTLWIGAPGYEISEVGVGPLFDLHTTAKNLFKNPELIFTTRLP